MKWCSGLGWLLLHAGGLGCRAPLPLLGFVVCWVGVVGLGSWVGCLGCGGALAFASACFLAAAAGACFVCGGAAGGGRWAMCPAGFDILLIFP